MPEPVDCLEGHVKRDPVTGFVALRTIFAYEETMGSQTWLVSTPFRGASFARPSDVAGWEDIYVPVPPTE